MISRNIFMVFFAAVLLFAQASANAAQVPQTINFQGYLTDPGGNPLSVTKIFSFSLYSAPTGGTALWTENQTVTTTRGIYNVVLGNTTPINLAFNVQYYLGVKVDVDPEMTPRQPLLTTGYSFRAQVANLVDSSATASIIPTGTVVAFAGTTAPAGWLLCDGTSYPQSTYTALYAVIGISHGGSGANFNVPDYQGRFLRGVDNTAGNDPDKTSRTAMKAGGNTGNAVGSIQVDQFASHTHAHTVLGGAVGNSPSDGALAWPQVGRVGSFTDTGSTYIANAGGNESRPKNAYVNYIIKY